MTAQAPPDGTAAGREPLCDRALVEVAALVATGAVSAVEVAEATLDRLAAVEPRVGAYVHLEPEAALAAARDVTQARAAGREPGPLAGVPLGVKDLIDVAGLPTGSGTGGPPRRPEADAPAVAALRHAGAVIVGKTRTDELAWGTTTPGTRNPWALDRVPGGSSGGSAAAVAVGGAHAALGTDTGGSVRIPAALCGVVGVKPTFGRVSRSGVTPLSRTLDHVGVLARSVTDAAAVLPRLCDHDPDDPGSIDALPSEIGDLERGVDGLVLGVVEPDDLAPVHPAIAQRTAAAAELLADAGARLQPVRLPLGAALRLDAGLCLLEAAADHAWRLEDPASELGEAVRTMLAAGRHQPAEDHAEALRARRALRDEAAAACAGVDVVALPTVPAPAVPVGHTTYAWGGGAEELVDDLYCRFTALANVTGWPAVSVPCGRDTDGLPVGLQLVGHPLRETTVLRVARAVEQRAGWTPTLPPVAVGT